MLDAANQSQASRRYESWRAPACIDAAKTVFARGIVTPDDRGGDGSMGDKCARVYVGTMPIGAACSVDHDCADGASCALVSPGKPDAQARVCAKPVPKSAGDFCADPGSRCETGSFCAMGEGGAPQCLAARSTGEPCDMRSTDAQCRAELRCTRDGVCGARLPAGAACESDADCGPDAPNCDTTLDSPRCDAGTSFAFGAGACDAFLRGKI
jgi:hypothetical protein